MFSNQDGATILDIQAGTITTLNMSGASIWRALETGEELEAIAERLARETGHDLRVVRQDVLGFVAALKTQRLLPD